MPAIRDPYSSFVRPVLEGRRGAVSAAHPLAVAAGQEILLAGGSAVDAVIAAQAVLTVLAPDACGLGGDMLCLVHEPGGGVFAINGAGAAPAGYGGEALEGANSITVPGIVGAWTLAARRWGKLPLERSLQPAIRLAREGFRLTGILEIARDAQRDRLLAGGAGEWALMGLKRGDLFVQPQLATLLEAIAREGDAGFYKGYAAEAISGSIGRLGGKLSIDDLAGHKSTIQTPIITEWQGVKIATQPPMAQGVLLNMALSAMEKAAPASGLASDHAGIELTEASFAYRSRVGEGEALLAETLSFDPDRALKRGGPRAYLHTAGVAASDETGLTVSSLVSVFDDFGSCVYVPECGITLNDRAAGFGLSPNDAAAGKRPVHTLAPTLVVSTEGSLALATPGADGQVQTLLQILSKIYGQGDDIAAAVAAPRWRSEQGNILIEKSHPHAEGLAAKGHTLRILEDGDTRLGAVVLAGSLQGAPICVSDWRRLTWSGVI
ncbi:gamma-glutamyltransferase [Neorhizobium alkalisoli]|uniref:Gamma-glutamyltranspeptidase/glutathione hydrolase n=1 Tax=Neorhizobium alkalisoli TaxID=528178 RepID=A0A561QG67_9HYPH|nr:gamma-glutamyltransferase [Neorhizobium alkalisoli]TWF49360.1 gamma-glutamyltranspeptidase/glutathione hydrolase [Neorhizobium alkalisoli]